LESHHFNPAGAGLQTSAVPVLNPLGALAHHIDIDWLREVYRRTEAMVWCRGVMPQPA
jgi:hypothetical protein